MQVVIFWEPSDSMKETLSVILIAHKIVESWTKRSPKVRLVRRAPPCGVGRALKAGFTSINSKAEYALSMDSDFVENISQVRALLNAIEERDCDGVIGSRFVEGGEVVGYPFLKRLMNRLFHRIVKALFKIKQNDLTNNFKQFPSSGLTEIHRWVSPSSACSSRPEAISKSSSTRSGLLARRKTKGLKLSRWRES